MFQFSKLDNLAIIIKPNTHVETHKFQLELPIGKVVIIKGELNGWCKGSVYPAIHDKGFFPMECVQMMEKSKSATHRNNQSVANAALQGQEKSFKIENLATARDAPQNAAMDALQGLFGKKKKITEEQIDLEKFAFELDKADPRPVSWFAPWLEVPQVPEVLNILDNFSDNFSELQKKPNLVDNVKKNILRYVEDACFLLREDVSFRLKKGPNKGQTASISNSTIVKLYRGFSNSAKNAEQIIQQLIEKGAKNKTQFKTRRAVSNAGDMAASPSVPTVGKQYFNLPEGNTQLLMDVHSCVFTLDEKCEVYFSLYSNDKKEFVSEPYLVRLPSYPSNTNPNIRYDYFKTIFKDLCARDFQSSLWLVIRVFKRTLVVKDGVKVEKNIEAQQVQPQASFHTNFNNAGEEHSRALREFKRPFALGLLFLDPARVHSLVAGEKYITNENISFYSTSKEEQFPQLHKLLIDAFYKDIKIKDLKDVLEIPSSYSKGVGVGLSLFIGDLDDVLSKEPELRSTSLTLMTDFSTDISPGDRRNDMYIKLESATVKYKTNNKDPKNVLVKVYVLVEDKIQDCLCSMIESDVIAMQQQWQAHRISQRISMSSLPALNQLGENAVAHSPSATSSSSASNDLLNLLETNEGEPIQRNLSTFVPKYDKFYTSTVYYHCKTPNWNETFKLVNLEPSKLSKTVLVFVLYNCPSRHSASCSPIALGWWIPLDSSKNTVKEDPLEGTVIPLYKYSKEMEKNLYSLIFNNFFETNTVTKSSLVLRHRVVSTRITQNEYLNQLLLFANSNLDRQQIMNNFLSKTDNIMSYIAFLREILDSLFGLLAENTKHEKITRLVYDALVNIIGQLNSIKHLEKYREILDEYLEYHFNANMAWQSLTQHMCQVLEQMHSTQGKAQEILSFTMKAVNQLTKFIALSRKQFEAQQWKLLEEDAVKYRWNDQQLQNRKHLLQAEKTEFSKQVLHILNQLNQLMQQTTPPTIIGSQGNLLKFIGNFFDHLMEVLDHSVLGNAMVQFLNHIPTDKKNMIQGKLNVIAMIVMGQPLQVSSIQQVILPVIIDILKMEYLEKRVETANTISVILDLFFAVEHVVGNKSDVMIPIFSLVYYLQEEFNLYSNSCKQITKEMQQLQTDDMLEKKQFELQSNRKGMTDILTCFASLLHIYNSNPSILLAEEKSTILPQLIIIWNDILEQLCHCVPRNWIYFRYLLLQLVQDSQMLISQQDLLYSSIVPEYLSSVYKMIPLPWLRLHQMKQFEKNVFLSRGVELRLTSLQIYYHTLLKQMEWQPEWITNQIPTLVNHILQVFHVENEALHTIALEMLVSMMEWEWAMNHQSLQRIETVTQQCITGFEQNSDVIQRNLINGLEYYMQQQEVEWKDKGMQMIQNWKELLQSQQEIQRYADTQEDEKTEACYKLLNYFYEHHSTDLYHMYLHILSNMHCNLKNYVESALALKKHADSLQWNKQTILPLFSEELPMQSEAERKESLLLKCVELFDKGKDWERAILILQELCEYYKSQFEYGKLEELFHWQGKCYTQIMEKKRYFAEYFLVHCFGKGFENSMFAGKFIYRGKELEKIGDFMNGMKARFPKAKVLVKPMEEEKRLVKMNKNKQYMEIYTVFPSNMDEYHNISPKLESIYPRIKSYIQSNDLNAFTYSIRYRESKEKTENEQKDLHRKMTFFFTEESFPCIRRRVKIVNEMIKDLSPLENACKDVEDKNTELFDCNFGVKVDKKPDANALSMQLNGVLDAAVNGGLTKYLQAFFCDEYIMSHPDHIELLERFYEALTTQLTLLKEGLQLRRKIVTGKGLGLSEHLEKLYVKTEEMINTIPAIIAKYKQNTKQNNSTKQESHTQQ